MVLFIAARTLRGPALTHHPCSISPIGLQTTGPGCKWPPLQGFAWVTGRRCAHEQPDCSPCPTVVYVGAKKGDELSLHVSFWGRCVHKPAAGKAGVRRGLAGQASLYRAVQQQQQSGGGTGGAAVRRTIQVQNAAATAHGSTQEAGTSNAAIAKALARRTARKLQQDPDVKKSLLGWQEEFRQRDEAAAAAAGAAAAAAAERRGDPPPPAAPPPEAPGWIQWLLFGPRGLVAVLYTAMGVEVLRAVACCGRGGCLPFQVDSTGGRARPLRAGEAEPMHTRMAVPNPASAQPFAHRSDRIGGAGVVELLHQPRDQSAYSVMMQAVSRHLSTLPHVGITDRDLALINGLLAGVADRTGVTGG